MADTFYRQLIHFRKGEISQQKYGQLKDVQASLLCYHPAKVYTEPAATAVEQHVATICAWAEAHNYPDTYSKKYETLAVTGATLSIYLTPNLEVGSKQLVAFGKFCSWLLTMDDVLDKLTSHESSLEQNTYANVSADLEAFPRVLDGKLTIGNGGAGVPTQVSTVGNFQVLLEVIQDVYNSFLEAITSYDVEKGYLVKAARDFLHGFLWRYRRTDLEQVPESTYLYFRRHHSASFVIFEIVALLNGIEWTKLDIDRDHIEFQSYRTAFASTIAMSNDVLSLRKEIADNETENLTIQKHEQGGLKITKALALCISYTNYETNETRVYAQRLLERRADDEVLKKLVLVEGLAIDGHLHWYGYTKRYGPIERQVKTVTEREYKAVLCQKYEQTWVEIGRINC